MASATSITSAEFQDALSRYPALIQRFSNDEKPSPVTLEQLDQFRYVDAPAAFAKSTGRVLEAKDVQQLTAWKLRHGKWRPSLTKLVASNSDEAIATATKVAFKQYAENPNDVASTIKALSAPLKGIGPATASLLLSVHDPENIIFFSDEAYRWLVANGHKSSLKYNVKEYEDLHIKTQALIKKLVDVKPMEIEKVAFVIIKESEPVKEAKQAYVPSGKPRGRPSKPESEKKQKAPAVPGRGRGRPPRETNGAETSAKAKQERPKPSTASAVKADASAIPAKKRGRPPLAKSEATIASVAPVAGKKRGRPPGAKNTNGPSAKKAKST